MLLVSKTARFVFSQLEVHEAKAMLDNHPQWDIPDTEEEDEEQEDSDGIEESDEDDEDDWEAEMHARSMPRPHPQTGHPFTSDKVVPAKIIKQKQKKTTHNESPDSFYTQSPHHLTVTMWQTVATEQFLFFTETCLILLHVEGISVNSDGARLCVSGCTSEWESVCK